MTTQRLVLLSDTHRMHAAVDVPAGDILVHAGDFSGHGTRRDLENFAAYFRALPHPHKIVIAGNHDRILEEEPQLGPELFQECHYLLDSGVEIEGLRFWGSPWQPEFLSWAFNLPRGEALETKWNLIPAGIDVLVTHGPPMAILDQLDSGESVGCQALRQAVARVRPRLHVFGHIHEGYGTLSSDGTLFVNASICTARYSPINRPVVVELDGRGAARLCV